MQSTLMRLLIAASLVLAPLAFAHSPAGTPDHTCQTPDEWGTHDYAGANGRTVALISDNNLEECGTTYGLFIAGTPECRELEVRFNAQDPSSPAHALWLLLCQTDRPADYDGDLEFALGGALLAVESGDGVTSGSVVCLGTLGHHGNSISVQDEVFGTNVAFTVGADASLVPPVPGEPDCGDNVTRPCQPNNSGLGPVVDTVLDLLQTGTCNPNDHRVTCLGSCDVPFGPGAEGTYVVWVHPTANAGPGGTPTGASHGHVTSGGGGVPLACGPDVFVAQNVVGGHSITLALGAGRLLVPGSASASAVTPSGTTVFAPLNPGFEWATHPVGDGGVHTYTYRIETVCTLNSALDAVYTGTFTVVG